jgi:hypothetical protein
MDLGKMLTYLAGYSLLSMVGFAVGLVCLVGLLLGAVAVIGHWAHRWGGHHEDGHADTLASFSWETAQDPGEAQENQTH